MRRSTTSTIASLLLALPSAPAWGQSLVGFHPPAALNTNAASDSGRDSAVRAATDGNTWIAVWESEDSLGGSIGNDSDILVARSLDAGVTWSAPMPLASTAVSDNRDDNLPQIATDGQGNWLVVWFSRSSLGGTLGTDRDIFVSRSSDDGASWSVPVPLNSNAATDSGNDDNPQIATDGQGTWIAVWVSTDNLGQTIATDEDILTARSTDAGASWSPPAPLNSNAARAERVDDWPRIATDRQGTWIAVWESSEGRGDLDRDRDILVSRSQDDGVSWGPSAALNTRARNDRASDFTPSIATDGLGLWITVWVQHKFDRDGGGTDAEIFFSRSEDVGVTWSKKERLHPNNQRNDWWPEIATDGLGVWAVVWYGERGNDPDILLARSGDGGLHWTKPEPVSNGQGDDRFPFLVTDGESWITVWESHDRLGGSIGDDRDILVATHSQAQTRAQSRCTGDHNKAASRLARARQKQTRSCVRAIAKGKGLPFTACLSDGPPEWKEVKRCLGVDEGGVRHRPFFGVAEAAAAEAAGLAAPVALAGDLFGADVDAALVSVDPDARCQQALLKESYGIFDLLWKATLDAKKRALDGRDFDGAPAPPPESAAELADALTRFLAADPKGTLTRAREKLPASIDAVCGKPNKPLQGSLPELFPGSCNAAAVDSLALANCTVERIRCRFCEQLNASDELAIDCDDFDDGAANASCMAP